MTALPEWCKGLHAKYRNDCLDCRKTQALAIAWEVLDYYKRMHDGKQRIYDVATDAMRDITELGEGLI